MIVRIVLAAALAGFSVPAIEADSAPNARSEAAKACAMKQHRIPAGKTVTAPIVKCDTPTSAGHDAVAQNDAKQKAPGEEPTARD